jgi:hypothetical protein
MALIVYMADGTSKEVILPLFLVSAAVCGLQVKFHAVLHVVAK